MSANRPRNFGLALACALALMSSACVVSPLVVDDRGPGGLGRGGQVAQGINPNIDAFTANPMATSDKDAKITFTVVAGSPTGAPLQYNWSATKGVLSTNTGQVVYWSPTKADGSLETPGDAQITVIITNASGGSRVGTATVKILADGSTKVGPIGAGTASPAPAASAKPSEKPSAAPSASPSAAVTLCDVTKVEPKAAAPSDKVTIHGSGFAGDVKVMLGELEAEIVQVNESTIVATVPAGATADDEAQALVVSVCGKEFKVEGGLVVEADLEDDGAATDVEHDDDATDVEDDADATDVEDDGAATDVEDDAAATDAP